MNTIKWNELDAVNRDCRGMVAVFWPCGPTLGLGDTLQEAIDDHNRLCVEPLRIDDVTEYGENADTEHICYAEIV